MNVSARWPKGLPGRPTRYASTGVGRWPWVGIAPSCLSAEKAGGCEVGLVVSNDKIARSAERSRKRGPPKRPPSVGSAFELLESKLRGPIPRRAVVPRSGLVHRLTGSREVPVVAVFAGPGYGK